MLLSHKTCKSWNRENETDHKASLLLLKQTKICALDIYTKAVKEKTIRIQKHQEPCSCQDLPALSHHLTGRLLNREIKSVDTNHKNPLWTAKFLWILRNDP